MPQRNLKSITTTKEYLAADVALVDQVELNALKENLGCSIYILWSWDGGSVGTLMIIKFLGFSLSKVKF